MSPSSGNKNGAEQGAQVPDQLREALENELERHTLSKRSAEPDQSRGVGSREL